MRWPSPQPEMELGGAILPNREAGVWKEGLGPGCPSAEGWFASCVGSKERAAILAKAGHRWSWSTVAGPSSLDKPQLADPQLLGTALYKEIRRYIN